MKMETKTKKTGSVEGCLASLLEEINGIAVDRPAEPKVDREKLQKWAKGMRSHGYIFSEESLNLLEDYLKGYNLWVMGNTGIGKTAFFKCISFVRQSIEDPKAYAMHSGYRPLSHLSMLSTQAWKMEDAREWLEQNKGEDVVLDDVGTEPKMVSYGQEAEVFPYLLEDRLGRRNVRTHVTTNLTLKDIEDRYGMRVRDRVNEMFKTRLLSSKTSMRKTKVWRRGEVV